MTKRRPGGGACGKGGEWNIGWGRENIRCLMVRNDLPDWPTAGKVDGFARARGDRGFVFLFNPKPKMLEAS